MSIAITPRDLDRAIERLQAAMADIGPELDALDARMGDGDTGTMLTRFVGALSGLDLASHAGMGEAFLRLAQAGSRSTGSSLGTLLVGALMTCGKSLKGRREIASDEFGELFASVRDDMLRRGKTELGNKTIVDGLDALARAFDFDTEPQDPGRVAHEAMDDALARFRDQPSASGRARMFADRTRGLDDPGMRALREMVVALAAKPQK